MKMIPTLLAVAFVLSGCLTVTEPDGKKTTSLSPLGAEIILRVADVAEAKILSEK